MKRLKILFWWLCGKSNETSLTEVLSFMFQPTFKNKGKAKEKMLEIEKDFYKADFYGFPCSIYWPKEFPYDSMLQVATELLYKNWWNYEIDENKVIIGDTVIDCGAAEGAFSVLVAERSKKVYAIEPHPSFIKAMKKTFSGFTNIEILPLGVGAEAGTLSLSTDGIMSKMTESSGIAVPIDTIDNLFFKKGIKVDFIKADLEGFEFEMLKGARNTIQLYKPKLAITTYHYKDDYSKISNYIKNVCPEYKIKPVGIVDRDGVPVMLHAWV